MTTRKGSPQPDSRWAAESRARVLRLRVKTFYNQDYFDRIILPLLELPQAGRILDAGCGYGGLALLLGRARPDLHITGVDLEASALESAARSAAKERLANLEFKVGDVHRLPFGAERFDAVVCQTVLTHVRAADVAVLEMARVLKPGGVFMAAEYTAPGAWTTYDSAGDHLRDEAWHEKYHRLRRLYNQGKLSLGRGDESLGVRLPLLATAAGLDVFDVRLNDRVLHAIPPYRHDKQQEYLELLRAMHAPDRESQQLETNTEILLAGGGSEEDARWLSKAVGSAALREAIEAQALSIVSAYRLYLTFARKPSQV